MQESLNELFNDALKTSEVMLAIEERYKDIGCQVCKVLSRTISGRGYLRKSPAKSSRWDLFSEPDCVTCTRWVQIRIILSLRKKNSPRKPEMFETTLDCYHLNQARIRTGPEHCLCYQAQPSGQVGQRPEGQAWARADLYCRYIYWYL
jgi:hypothetical protein